MTDDELKAAAETVCKEGSVLLPKALTAEQIRKLNEYIKLFYPESKGVPWNK